MCCMLSFPVLAAAQLAITGSNLEQVTRGGDCEIGHLAGAFPSAGFLLHQVGFLRHDNLYMYCGRRLLTRTAHGDDGHLRSVSKQE